VVRSLAGRRKLAEVGRPKLLHANDFFSEENGFAVDLEGNHRRLADSETQGWAAFSLSAGKEIMDVASEQDAVDYESVYFHADLHTTAEGYGDVVLDVELYFTENVNKEEAIGSKVRIEDPSGGSYLTDHGLGFGFKFDESGTLVKCESLGELSDPTEGLESLAVAASEDGLTLVITDDAAENLIRIDRASIEFDTSGEKLVVPSVEECAALSGQGNKLPDGEVDEVTGEPEDLSSWVEEDGRRKLWTGGSVSDKELWEAAHGSYKTSTPSGWTTWATCEGDNAFAKFMYKYPVMVIGFAGTDGLSDFSDWVDNLNLDTTNPSGQANVHEGFYNYQGKVSGCIIGKKNQLAGWGIDIDYIVGHSLGGAAATVWSQHNDNPAVHGVYTFGAPKTRQDGSCSVPGKRFAHESDAISSNVMGILGNFNHDVQNSVKAYKESYCSSDCWAGCCPWGWSDRKKTSTQTCSDNSGGCSWLADCVYYFATVHSEYGEYL
jgi:hypothetical protein